MTKHIDFSATTTPLDPRDATLTIAQFSAVVAAELAKFNGGGRRDDRRTLGTIVATALARACAAVESRSASYREFWVRFVRGRGARKGTKSIDRALHTVDEGDLRAHGPRPAPGSVRRWWDELERRGAVPGRDYRNVAMDGVADGFDRRGSDRPIAARTSGIGWLPGLGDAPVIIGDTVIEAVEAGRGPPFHRLSRVRDADADAIGGPFAQLDGDGMRAREGGGAVVPSQRSTRVPPRRVRDRDPRFAAPGPLGIGSPHRRPIVADVRIGSIVTHDGGQYLCIGTTLSGKLTFVPAPRERRGRAAARRD